ncbi:MAG: hypothetical protein RMJ56_11990 [Gemmataceae bacterium]|nr:hypothetical protein [Gemmata sp.]MDW8198312.1 hypothetical protein [Gemmataceae bacterium]
MATDTALAAVSPPTDPTRHFWQVPLLLAAVVLFVATWKGWLPLGPADPAAAFVQDVIALKNAYEKVTPDPTELKNLLNRVAANIELYPDLAPTARFHLGSGYVRLAEITPALDESYGYWTLARQHFDLVKDQQLRDPADAPKLAFRSAKAQAAVGLPPGFPNANIAILINILSAPQQNEEPGETHRLIADLALQMTPPDVSRAKIALTQYLTAGISTPPIALARARLRLGELYLAERQYDQALRWLKEIGTDAPPEILAPAKTLLAQVYMGQGNWLDATKELETLRAAPGVPPLLRQAAAYQLGVCKLKLREVDIAARLFEEAAKGDTAEARAAALQLADLHFRSNDPARHKLAVELLSRALAGIREPAHYDPTLIPLNEAQATLELAITTLVNDNLFETALTVAESYAAIAPPGRDRERRADILTAWGIAWEKSQPQDARAKFQAAAAEYVALTPLQPKSDGKLEMLRRAAACSRRAHDPSAAAARLEEALQLPDLPENILPSVWLELADALLAANRPDDVLKIFNKIMAAGTPPATAARYRLARAFVETRHRGLLPVGRALLEQITKQQNVTPEEREYHERAFSDLAFLLIHDGQFADAEARARAQLGLYPNGPYAPQARLLLGVALLQRASSPGVAEGDATKMRQEALGHFKQVVADCDAIERRTGRLSEADARLRAQAAVRILQAYQKMQTIPSARDLLYEANFMLERYKGTVEELIILSLMYHAFKQLNDPGSALSIFDRMKDVFDHLPPSAFTQKTGEYSREYWEKVWFKPEKK